MTNLKERLEKRRDEKVATIDYEDDARQSYEDGQDDLIPVIVKLAEALERQMAELDSYGSRKPGQQALEELEAWVSGTSRTTTNENETKGE